MEEKIREEKLTVQGLITPVPAASVPATRQLSSSSLDREHANLSTPTGVGALAPVVEVKITSTTTAIGKTEDEEKDDLRGSENLTQPLNTGGESDSDSNSNDNVNITIVANSNNEEVSKMVDAVSESIAKLTTKPKKLSGAQRRKLKKLNRDSQKITLTQDASKDLSETPSTSAEAAKRIRSPEEQNTVKNQPKKIKSSSPSSRKGKPKQEPNSRVSKENQPKEGVEVNPTTKKVGTSAESSVQHRESEKKPHAARKRKMEVIKGKELPSYAKVARKQRADNLSYAVIDINCASGKIPTDQRKNVEDLVNNKILEHILDPDGRPPVELGIMSCEFKGDVMLIRLASSACAETLKELVESIPTPWNGAKLGLVRKRDIPKLHKATVYIKGWGSQLTTDRLLSVFGRQNKDLFVDKWQVFHRKDDHEGTLLVVGLDQLSMESLAKTKGMAFCVTQAVYFKIGKARLGFDAQPKETSVGKGDKEKTAQPNNEEGVENTISDSQEARLLEDQ